MDISFRAEEVTPKFLLRDRNGYALAKAIERAFQAAAEAAQDGLDIISDPAKMPEWRLDEMARELNCLYDFDAGVEQKRYWIANATKLYAISGTKSAIERFLGAYFSAVQVREAWEYEGTAHHFRVTVTDSVYSQEKMAWARKAAEELKNVRSVLDTVEISVGAGGFVLGASTEAWKLDLLYAGDEQWCNANDIDDWDEITHEIQDAQTDVTLIGASVLSE